MRRTKYAPKHRGAPPEAPLQKGLRKSVTYSGIAVAATGIAVTGGVAAQDAEPEGATATIASAQAERQAERTAGGKHAAGRAATEVRDLDVSRSDRRTSESKQQARHSHGDGGSTRTADLSQEDPREIARRLMPQYGLAPEEFDCLDQLWISESDWDPHADNPTSTAYGIPQALTGGTHENLPHDYMTNPVSQIKWGLWYIEKSYGSACSAWEFKQANNWY